MTVSSDRPMVAAISPQAGRPEPSAAAGDQAPEHADASPTPLWVLAAAGLLSCAALAAVCWMSGHVHADTTLQTVARFLHVAALVVGLGAVLAVDWFALLWLLGRRRLADILNTACTLQVPIWLGLAGLVATGSFLNPNLTSTLTLIKLGLVLAITLNGLYAHRLGQHLDQYRDRPVPRSLLVQSGAAATVSQLGWWGASLIGFINSQS
ncbi:hypothetical protein EAO75_39375 [Streptomyces sp. uw30]|uniref:hypothetical protein n=1 Tax=Streptomyces sp. uw30 TaxID=1828179 RepID=UPI0011CECF09|nr:hypothetical protein [Streptomyces sp. uw30]TXS40917.1 hypothetical protein EAO75_39375 [Streptomyces sp. uw30]